MEIFNTIINSDAFAYVSTVIAFIVGVLNIIKNTSIGKKSLNKLTELHNSKNDELAKAKKTIAEAEEKIGLAEEKINELTENKDKIIESVKQEADAKYQLLCDTFNNKINIVFDCLSKVNNDQIKNIINEYKTSLTNEKEVIISEIIQKANAYDELIKRVEALEQYGRENNQTTEE